MGLFVGGCFGHFQQFCHFTQLIFFKMPHYDTYGYKKQIGEETSFFWALDFCPSGSPALAASTSALLQRCWQGCAPARDPGASPAGHDSGHGCCRYVCPSPGLARTRWQQALHLLADGLNGFVNGCQAVTGGFIRMSQFRRLLDLIFDLSQW